MIIGITFGSFADTSPGTRVDRIVEAIKENMDAGVDAVWPGSDLWPDIQQENIRAIVDTVHDYGRKPSPAVGRVG